MVVQKMAMSVPFGMAIAGSWRRRWRKRWGRGHQTAGEALPLSEAGGGAQRKRNFATGDSQRRAGRSPGHGAETTLRASEPKAGRETVAGPTPGPFHRLPGPPDTGATPALTQCPWDAEIAVVKWGLRLPETFVLRPPTMCAALGWPQPSLSLAGSSVTRG